MPEYLRFLHGIVDSEDLPLNVSRETLQDNSVIRKIRNTLVKGVLDKLQKLAEESPKDYLTFYRQFGQTLKEGTARDPANRERVAKLLRFSSTNADDPDAPTSFDEYVKRSPEGQKAIYYLGGPDLASIKKNPNLEIFRRRGLEVLFLTDPVDEFVFSSLGSFGDRPLVSIDAADVELPPETDEAEGRAARSEAPSGSLGRVLTLSRRR